MKIRLIITLLVTTTATAFCQEDKIFKEQITVEKGIRFGDGTVQLTAPDNQSLTFFSGDWNDLTNKPPEIDFNELLNEMRIVLVLKRKTSEIASLQATEGIIVYDIDKKTWQGYDGEKWKTFITDK
jgi:hypothetical protein